ncbi:MAG: Urea carboxylase-related aminomethyltransferase [Frankiales bacterium]|nr:Urea carboxylase-related aminomethyltransferase [Frankiales bacterium]
MTREYLYGVEVPGGSGWSVVVRRRHALRLTALAPDSNVSMLAFAIDDPTERLNVPDTLKAQLSAMVRPPMALMSDMGRALLTVTSSSLSWHDAITGHGLDADIDARFGGSSYQHERNEWRRSARACLLEELRVHGRDTQDLHATVNWFTKVQPGDDDRGTMRFVQGHAHEGDHVEVRAEVDVLVVIATSPHPLNPDTQWRPAPVRAEVFAVPAAADDDPSRVFRDETARSLIVAQRSHA